MYLNTDILFTTTDSVSGREITDYLGILIKREILPASISFPEMQYALDARYASLAASMNARAADIGADAVVGVDFKMDLLGNKIVFTMTGNAVRLKSVDCAAAIPEEEPCAPSIEAPVPAEIEEAFIEEEEPTVSEQPEAEEIAPQETEEESFFDEIVPEEEETLPEEVPEDIFVFEEAEPEPEGDWQCINCGAENEPQYLYCHRCGTMRSFDWKCDGCGQENPPEYRFCPGCGKPRKE